MINSAGDVEDNVALVDALGDHTLIAISIRGRGASSSPEAGWTVGAQASDVAAVIAQEHVPRYHLVAHSMGVAYALHHALADTPRIASFTAADYRPGLVALAEEWVQMIESLPDRPERFDRRIARRMLRENTGEYAPELAPLAMPVLAILGSESTDPFVEGMWMRAPDARVVWIQHGHDTFSNDSGRRALVEHVLRAESR